MKKTFLLIMLGAILEYYDFAIFIYFASAIGNSLIPIHDHTANIIASFGIFAVGAMIRPLGGVFFSHFGDTRGRKNIFIYTILLMAIPTLLVAFIPDYNQIGISATIILLILRCVQGLAIGGEIPGSVVFAYELSKPHNKALSTNIVIAGTNVGFFLASLLGAYLLNSTIHSIEPWRIAFIIGGAFGIISYYLRKNLVETPEFIQYKTFIDAKPQTPLIQLLRNHYRELFEMVAFGSLLSSSLAVYTFFMPTYLNTYYHLPLKTILEYNSYSIIIFVVSAFLSGKFYYWFGRSFLIWSILLFNVVNFSIFPYYSQLNIHQIALIHCVILFYLGIICGRLPVLSASFFPTKIRYSGVALSYNICFGIVAGSTQLILFILIKMTGILWIPALYIAFFSCFALIFLYKVNARKLIEYA